MIYFRLRNYGFDGQIGQEDSIEEYVENLVKVFREVRRVLRDDGTLWLNLGDTYARDGRFGVPAKNLLGIPFRVAFALQADDFIWRSTIIWAKGNCVPESVKDRPTNSHEYVFLFAKSKKYFYDYEASREPTSKHPANVSRARYPRTLSMKGKYAQEALRGFVHQPITPIASPDGKRNRRSVLFVNTTPNKIRHFATYPPKLIEPFIVAGSPEKACPHCLAPWVREMRTIGKAIQRWNDHDSTPTKVGREVAVKEQIGWKATCSCTDNDGSGKGIVLDPFFGSGTTGAVAQSLGRNWIGIEANPDYVKIAQERLYENTL